MTSTHFRAGALACALLASTALATPALAQVSSPTFRQADRNGVDLVHGDLVASFTEGTIGSGEGAISLMRRLGNAGSSASQASQWDPIMLTYAPGNGTYVDFGTRHDKFPGAEARGSTLTGSGGSYQYITPDGTVIAFTNNEPENEASVSNLCRSGSTSNCILLPTSITSPDGKVVTLEYDFWQMCIRLTPPGEPPSPDDPLDCTFTPRLAKISNSFGYAIKFSYAASGYNPNQNPSAAWRQRTGAQFFNNIISTTVPQASVSYSYPSSGVTEISDMGQRVWRLTGNSTTVALRRPGAASDTTSYNLSSGKVTSATVEGITTNYNRSVVGSTVTMTVTDALNQPTVVTSNAATGRPSSIKDPLNRTTSFQYDGSGRLIRTTMPEDNYVQLTHDGRGNVIETLAVAKPGSGLANIVATASFDTNCANPKTCNKPVWTRDANGNQTDYTYDPTHGGVLTVTAPAPTSGATRPQTRYSYALTNGEYLLTGVSACQTLGGAFGGNPAACAGTADEVKSTVSYDANGNVVETSTGNGNGTLTASQAMTYDAMGNLLTVDGPLAGSADTVRHRYNSARELVGTVSPDPDAPDTGLQHRATRNSYTNGLLTRQERGTVESQSDPHWAAFDPAEVVDLGYDANARLTSRKLSSDTGTAYALSQTSYDALGRPECAATRMNREVYGSALPGACSLGTQGIDGPDRITKIVYNDAGEVIEQQVAVGTADHATEATFTYTDNGKLQTLKDAENNLTTYLYDGFDRLSETRYPTRTPKGAGTSDPTDNEQYGYDASGNMTWRKLRDGQVIGYAIDALGRVTWMDLPGSEPDPGFGYDNLGRLISAGPPGLALSFGYDALGRQTGETQLYGSVSRQFDLVGRMTRLTWHDGFYVDYDRRVTGEISQVRENGATSGPGVLASYYYDNLGRRVSLVYGNGTANYYAYDPVSRLAGMTIELAGTASDLTIGSIAYNPAGQIVSQLRSNDAYSWTGHGSGSIGSDANGLNQLHNVGGGTASYDLRGNMTSDPTTGRSFTYGSRNELKSSGTFGLAYDALGRLADTNVSAGSWKQFFYDGVQVAGMQEPGQGITARYVWGDGPDELLVDYAGSGTASRRWAHQDERGSVVALSDSSGNPVAINRYDEFGKPQAGNTGRFQYTGQMWLPEAGLYHYKARAYAPHLGRFVQTDPIGYAGGTNLYAYVGNDPVNWIDPTGLCTATWDDIYKGYLDGSEEWVGSENFKLNGCDPFGGAGGEGPYFYGGGGRGGGGRSDGDEGQDQSDPCSGESDGAYVRRVGGSMSDVGVGTQIAGAVASVAVHPEVGVPIVGFGTLLEGGGDLLTIGGFAMDGDIIGAAGFALDAWIARATGRRYRQLATGAWRNINGRFAKNPLGGKQRDAKRRASEKAAEKVSEQAREAAICGR